MVIRIPKPSNVAKMLVVMTKSSSLVAPTENAYKSPKSYKRNYLKILTCKQENFIRLVIAVLSQTVKLNTIN